MGSVWWILLALLLCCGFLGCFINKVPGPIAVVLASLIGITALDVDLEWGHFAIIAVLAVVSIIASKVLVKLAKKMQEYSKRATIGTTIGSIIGLILIAGASSMDSDVAVIVTAIVGLVVLPFVLAFLLELTNKNGAAMAVKCATAATCAYLSDTCLKLVVFIYAVYMMFLG